MDDLIPLEPVAELSHVARLRLIIRQCFALSDRDAADIIASVGEVQFRNGKPILQPGAISKARFCNWMNSHNGMPLWRLGAAVAALEFYALEKTALYVKAKLKPNDPRLSGFATGLEELHSLGEDEAISGWLWKFRSAILLRLQTDARTDKTAKAQLVRYTMLIEDLKKEMEEGK